MLRSIDFKIECIRTKYNHDYEFTVQFDINYIQKYEVPAPLQHIPSVISIKK